MKKMKKLLALVLAFVMVFALAACGGGGDETDDGGNKLEVAVFYYTFNDPYISSVRTALDKALKGIGVKYQNYDGAGDQKTQTEQVQTAVTKGAQLLIVNIVETASDDAAMDIVAKAKAKNIPVIFFNREVKNEIVNSYDKCAFVGTDAAEAGHLQGKMIGEYLVENYDKADLNKDGEISYVMFKGQQNNAEAEYRTKFAVEDANKVLTDAGKKPLKFYDAKNKDLYLVDKNGTWSAQASNEYMKTIFSQYSVAKNNMVELVIANNDDMAMGAVNALNELGFNTGDDKFIPVFGVDATAAAKEFIAARKMVGTIKQDAEGMSNAITLLTKNTAEGKALMDGTDTLNVDDDCAKIRIPYGIYTGK